MQSPDGDQLETPETLRIRSEALQAITDDLVKNRIDHNEFITCCQLAGASPEETTTFVNQATSRRERIADKEKEI